MLKVTEGFCVNRTATLPPVLTRQAHCRSKIVPDATVDVARLEIMPMDGRCLIPIFWQRCLPLCITWMARFAMRSMSTGHSSRARCTPLVLFVPIVMSLTAISWLQKATPFVVNATIPVLLIPQLITITSWGRSAVSV